MYSKDMLIGIMLTAGKLDFNIERASDSQIGYRVRVKIILRAEESFLRAVERTLLQHEITSSYKEKESKTRPKPILKIGGIKNLYKLTELVPVLPDAKGEWGTFRELVELISENKHRTSSGLDRIFELKGVI
jgi:hypothetical protein|tara:strand:- start:1660 stop:2055 length:396 start_codon:yes stop_codon:yes gene_type:complete